MDVRYNVINWVHRSTRGWSYGAASPIRARARSSRATCSLGSLRVRQDYMIFEGLLSPYTTGDEKPPVLEATALARCASWRAHETGHTLGLAHNYYDSTMGRISVMDYPHPLVTLKPDGTIDMSNAYATGIGEWDKVADQLGLRRLPAGHEQKAALDKILNDAWAKDLRYLTNQDIDVNPRVDQWSNGTNAAGRT